MSYRLSLQLINGEVSELVEGARLEIVCALRGVPRVRIPPSPIRATGPLQ